VVESVASKERLTDEIVCHYLSQGLPETQSMARELLERRAGETPAECPGHYKVAALNVCTMFPHCLCSPEARAAEAAEDARHPKAAATNAPARRVESVLDFKVTVCSECLQASCWLGEFYCEQHREASTVIKTVRELHALGPLEDAGWWFKSADDGKVNYQMLDAFYRAIEAISPKTPGGTP